jgi:prepilin-type N-terminal cleavage/methylation domain-containing protein
MTGKKYWGLPSVSSGTELNKLQLMRARPALPSKCRQERMGTQSRNPQRLWKNHSRSLQLIDFTFVRQLVLHLHLFTAKEKNMQRARGFTLIELAVVLAIIAVLAAILTPLVTNYLEQARIARATAETRTIADSIRLFHRDTGKYPIHTAANQTTSAFAWFVGPGSDAPSGIAGTSSTLLSFVNMNLAGAPSSGKMGSAAHRGPYIGALELDPWGQSYAVTGTNLEASSANWAFVVSGGPDTIVMTSTTQPKTGQPAAAGDDIIAVIK